ncbi:hypothetical protein B0H17DRAFT_1149853 [Mycena rosella]|uniref:Uncharacterized protein n=1 Tax=Mycena rosella TaxID=1033263 RepID=A0AAD7BY10_MYCRO|nr:hypothetical protein B0H17DRAFT_1149853 [Mycena rosella]
MPPSASSPPSMLPGHHPLLPTPCYPSTRQSSPPSTLPRPLDPCGRSGAIFGAMPYAVQRLNTNNYTTAPPLQPLSAMPRPAFTLVHKVRRDAPRIASLPVLTHVRADSSPGPPSSALPVEESLMDLPDLLVVFSGPRQTTSSANENSDTMMSDSQGSSTSKNILWCIANNTNLHDSQAPFPFLPLENVESDFDENSEAD